MSSTDWSTKEVRALVDDYFDMLRSELRAEPYNKKEHRESLGADIPNRSKGAIEYKHQNVSAILDELGLPWIEGYKPKRNYQELLKTEVLRKLQCLIAK